MGRIFLDANRIVMDTIFITALLTALAYARWHYWWRSGWGRSRMLLMLAIAGLTLQPVTAWLPFRAAVGSATTADWIGFTASIAVLIVLVHMLGVIVVRNFRRARSPDDGNDLALRHLTRTPWATRQDIEKLTACWNEMHSCQQDYQDR